MSQTPELCGETVRVLRGKHEGLIATVVQQRQDRCLLLEILGGDTNIMVGEIEFEYSTSELVLATREEIAAYNWSFTPHGAELCSLIGHKWENFTSLYDKRYSYRCRNCEKWCTGNLITDEERARGMAEMQLAQTQLRAMMERNGEFIP